MSQISNGQSVHVIYHRVNYVFLYSIFQTFLILSDLHLNSSGCKNTTRLHLGSKQKKITQLLFSYLLLLSTAVCTKHYFIMHTCLAANLHIIYSFLVVAWSTASEVL